MLNWNCTNCHALNSPRRTQCWQCGQMRAAFDPPDAAEDRVEESVKATVGEPPASQSRTLHARLLWNQAPRFLGVLGVIVLVVSLFLPWVARATPDGTQELLLGYSLRYGQVTAFIALILFYLMLRSGMAKGWYVLATILALACIVLSRVPFQVMQVFDAVEAQLAGVELITPVSSAGTGVSVAGWGSILIVISAVLRIFLPAPTDSLPDSAGSRTVTQP